MLLLARGNNIRLKCGVNIAILCKIGFLSILDISETLHKQYRNKLFFLSVVFFVV